MSRALFIIDVQNDFTEGGALAVDGGSAVAAGITSYLESATGRYDVIVGSRDWHTSGSDNGGHFHAEPDFSSTWPEHCVENTPGAEYHPALDVALIDIHVKKGQGEPAYSIFEGVAAGGEHNGEKVSALLDLHGVTEVDIVGLATDHCVRASALDAIEHGRHVRVLTDLIAGVADETSERALAELGHAGAVITSSTATP